MYGSCHQGTAINISITKFFTEFFEEVYSHNKKNRVLDWCLNKWYIFGVKIVLQVDWICFCSDCLTLTDCLTTWWLPSIFFFVGNLSQFGYFHIGFYYSKTRLKTKQIRSNKQQLKLYPKIIKVQSQFSFLSVKNYFILFYVIRLRFCIWIRIM